MPTAIFLLLATNSVTEVTFDYTDQCNMTNILDPKRGPKCNNTIRIDLPSRMEPPIYLYYKLENFYQNHRRYATSRDDYQLSGSQRIFSDVSTNCYPIIQNAFYQDSNIISGNRTYKIYNPCGLIAWSMFNDTFIIRDSNKILCNGPKPDEIQCSKNQIAWPSDINYKFKAPNEVGALAYPNSYFNETGHIIPRTNDTDFMVWMRTAALPNFRKLHRIIMIPLEGTIYVDVQQNFPVKQFQGRKSIVITTASWFGGKNLFLSICYFVVAGFSGILVIIFTLSAIIFGRLNFFTGLFKGNKKNIINE